MKLRRLCVLVLLTGAACGVQPVELLPATAAVGADEFVVDQVHAQALARLRSQRSEQGKEILRFLYPAPPELVMPADLAPIVFEWLGAKGKAPELPMGMAMPMPTEPQPPAAGRAAEMMAGPKADKAKADKADKESVIAYELRAHSELADVRVYVAAERVAFPRERWRSLLRAHSGSTLSIELRGVYASGEFVHAAPLQLRVRPDMPAGIFYNFSATSKGLTRGQIADTHERTEFVPSPIEPAPTPRCVGCHAVSRDGQRILATSVAPPTLLRWSLSSSVAPLWFDWPGASEPERAYIQGSFDAGAARVAATRAGQLAIFNADTGALLERSAAPLMAAVAAPDWSPDGRTIVVETARDMLESDGGSLATLEVGLDGSLSALMPLINATGDERLRAPSYSPDAGEWIAYERRMGPPGDAKDPKLFLVRARGGEPIELRSLSQGVKPMDGASAPTFARGDAPGHVYLLFSSKRPVGSFVPAEGQRQLFAAELDLSLAAEGKDPSHAAFWLPFQQRTNSYLRTQWAPALAACTPSREVEVCDDADDDCDDVVDEDCCTPAAESCGDAADNDCDSAVDEGCDCAFQEACGNLRDDDCDLQVDEKPCMPAPPMR